MICLDDQDYIKQALESCPFADEIVVVDGGSEDGTLLLIEEMKQAGLPIRLVRNRWDNDFGRQRQVSLNNVSPETDWWLRLDSDETYPPLFRDNVRIALELAGQDVVAYRVRQSNLYPDETHYAASHGGWETWSRIFRNIRTPEGKTALHWTGQVHEHIMMMTPDGLKDIAEDRITDWNAPVTHWGWLSDDRRKAREELYMEIPGSGVEKLGDLRDRPYEVRLLPHKP